MKQYKILDEILIEILNSLNEYTIENAIKKAWAEKSIEGRFRIKELRANDNTEFYSGYTNRYTFYLHHNPANEEIFHFTVIVYYDSDVIGQFSNESITTLAYDVFEHFEYRLADEAPAISSRWLENQKEKKHVV